MVDSSWLIVLKHIMAFRFEDLQVWQKALVLCNEIDLMVKSFPIEERYSLSSQMKRAADSVVLNIAEGSTGQSIPEFKRFLNIALRPAVEVVACLFISKTRNYLEEDSFKIKYEEYEILCKMITKLKSSM